MAFTGYQLCKVPNCWRKKTGKNPTDRGKQGTKRSILTEAKGIPIGIIVAPANRADNRLMTSTIKSIPIKRPKPRKYWQQNICLDAGYVGEWIQTWLKKHKFIPHVRPKGERRAAIRKKRFKQKRWVVEQTFGCLNRNRSIQTRWEKEPESYEAMLHLAAAILIFARIRRKK